MQRRALLLGVPDRGLNVELAIERLTPALARLGFAEIDRCVGRDATRAGILARLDALEQQAERCDAALVFFFGHGGRVSFSDLPEPWADHVFGYITCHRATRGGPWEAVLDQELSARLTAIEARCGNVTALLDCCFSAELVRDTKAAAPDHRVEQASDWVRSVIEPSRSVGLAVESHPSIVRLCGASAKREAYAATRGGRQIGRLTEALLTTLDEAGDAWPRLPWAFAAHRIREHVVDALDMEGQWVNLAGPHHRTLLSTHAVALPGTVAYVPSDDPLRGWIRAGWQQGVAVGDRWAILGTCLGEDGLPVELAVATVETIGRNRADVVSSAPPAGPLLPGQPACPKEIAAPLAVAVPPALADAVRASAWLRLADSEATTTQILEDAGTLVVQSTDAPSLELVTDDPAVAIAQLEARARLLSIERSLATQRPSQCPVRWTWFRADNNEELPAAGASLSADDKIWIELRFEGTAPLHWFVAVLLVDPAGGLTLLNTRMPEGIELGPGHRETIGVRPGRPEQGLTLSWPSGLAPGQGTARLLFLASRRPISLGHIVQAHALDDDAQLAVDRAADPTMRSHRPEHARGCAWEWFTFTLCHRG